MSFDSEVLGLSGIVSYWKLEDSGTTATDSAGSNDGTIVGTPTTQQPGPYADTGSILSLEFDGSNDEVDIGSPASLDNIWAGGATIGLWLYADPVGFQNNDRIFHKNEWFMRSDSDPNADGAYPLYFEYDYAGGKVETLTDFCWYTGRWHFLVMTFDSDTPTALPKLYKDGYYYPWIATDIGTGAAKSDVGLDLLLGSSGGNRFTGRMSRVFITSDILTPEKIRDLYLEARPGYTARAYCHFVQGPVAYWRLNEASGDFKDHSGNGIDLTPVNTPTREVATPLHDDNALGASFASGSSEYAWRSESDWRDDANGSIFAVVRRDSSGQTVIFSTHDDSAPAARSLTFEITAGGKLRLLVDQGGTVNDVQGSDSPGDGHSVVLPENNWMSVAVTADSGANEYLFYVNGHVLDTTVNSGSDDGDWFSSISPGRDNIAIGAKLDSTPTYTDVSLDEVMVFSEVLSPETILNLHVELLPDGPSGSARITPRAHVPFWSPPNDWGYEPAELVASGAPSTGQDGPYIPASVSKAVAFDGVDDYYTYGDTSAGMVDNMLGSGSWTLGVWVKFDDHTKDRRTTFVGNTASSSDSGFALSFENRSSQGSPKRVEFYYNRSTDGTDDVLIASGNNHITDNDWHHIAVREDGTNVYLYVDGVEINQTTRATFGTESVTYAVTFGALNGATVSEYFEGQLSDFVYYYNNEGAAWPKQAYAMGKSRFTQVALKSGPFAYYLLNETSGSTADELMSDFDGTYFNTPTLGETTLVPIADLGTSISLAAASNEYMATPIDVYQQWGSNDDFSMLVWVELPGSDPGAQRTIYSMTKHGGDNDGFHLYINASGELVAEENDDSKGANQAIYDLTGLWGSNILVGYVRRAIDHMPTLYVEGYGRAHEYEPVNLDNTNGTDMSGGNLGRYQTSTANDWDGGLDDLVFFNHQVTPCEMYAYFGSGNDPAPEVIECVVATGTWAPVNCAINEAQGILCGTDAGTWAPVQCLVEQDEVINCATDSATWAPLACQILSEEVIDCATDAGTWASINAQILTAEDIQCTVDTGTWASVSFALNEEELFNTTPATATWAPVQCELRQDEVFDLGTDSGTWAPVQCAINAEETYNTVPDTATWSPVQAAIIDANVIDCTTAEAEWASIQAAICTDELYEPAPSAGSWNAIDCIINQLIEIEGVVATGEWAAIGCDVIEDNTILTIPGEGEWAPVGAMVVGDELFETAPVSATWAPVQCEIVSEELYETTPATGTWAPVQCEILSPHLYEMTPAAGTWAPVQCSVRLDSIYTMVPMTGTWAPVQCEIVNENTFNFPTPGTGGGADTGTWAPVQCEIVNEATFNFPTPGTGGGADTGTWAPVQCEIVQAEEIDVDVGTGTWAPAGTVDINEEQTFNTSPTGGAAATWAPVPCFICQDEVLDLSGAAGGTWAPVPCDFNSGARFLAALTVIHIVEDDQVGPDRTP